ncbi:tRNA (adenosine(37)-N6)-threonylcarbamoyltransferase complex dimerization subunit type 1 TsaB [Legionella sp. CNM-4043-24]|uniref:tRNA (adenosine(37)-N6)-threonylcarbamoyltransferase complex dimerization subunit type 1 TsaB n=1 Tax=Legionella sp. CNM-4043-24 TaxID=3421646 RepID=UPI00403AD7BF
MKLLAIDASTECASVALLSSGAISRDVQPAQRQHARLILPMIERLLQDADIRMAQLDGVVFGRGPGSFTGLRIACSVAKGLAYAHDLPVYPVSSLASIAGELWHQRPDLATRPVLSVIDARMNQLYWACYGLGEEGEQVSDAGAVSVPGEQKLVLAGSGFEAYREQLPAELLARIESEHPLYPDAAAMIRLVVAGDVQAVQASEALPVYVRNNIVQGDDRG